MRTPGTRLVGVLAVGMLVMIWVASPALGSSPPPQGGTPHPTLPPLPGPPPGGAGGGAPAAGAAPAGNLCAGLRGTVVNWGFHNEPGVTLRLGNGSWEAVQVTSDDGRYGFGPLGQGVALLSMDLSPNQAETLQPMAGDMAIRLRCDFDVVANLGLYSGLDRPVPPATVTMNVSPASLLPGGTATFSLTLKNAMPHPISHVFVTDYLPDGLTVSDVTTTLGTVEVLDGRMITVSVGDLPQGGEEKIQIVVQADPALTYGTRLQNTASLLYAESVADQAGVTLVVGGAGGAPAATPTPTLGAPVVEAVTPSPVTTATVSPEETPTVLPPTPGATQTPGPSNELLPVTGQGAVVALPVVGIGLAIVALGVRRLRQRVAGR